MPLKFRVTSPAQQPLENSAPIADPAPYYSGNIFPDGTDPVEFGAAIVVCETRDSCSYTTSQFSISGTGVVEDT